MSRIPALVLVFLAAACGSDPAADDGPDAAAPDAIAPDARPPSGATIATGFDASCSVRPSGGARCWGDNTNGKLGHGDVEPLGDDELPSTAGDIPVAGETAQVVMGARHACALDTAGTVRCWGANDAGQLGSGVPDQEIHDAAQAVVVDLGGPVVELAALGVATCARMGTGAVRCWGSNGQGVLGTGVPDPIGDDEPASAGGEVPLGRPAVEIRAAVFEVCAVLDDGAVRCWGNRWDGVIIGDDEPASDAPAIDLGEAAVAVRPGVAAACAILAGGRIRCWGDNALGRLGYGDPQPVGDDETPAEAGDVPVDGVVVDVALGRSHACAVLDDGGVRCWGAGSPSSGVPNTGSQFDAAQAYAVDVGGRVVAISAHRWHTCALLDDGAVRCWGQGGEGALGYGSTDDVGDDETPAMAGDVPVD